MKIMYCLLANIRLRIVEKAELNITVFYKSSPMQILLVTSAILTSNHTQYHHEFLLLPHKNFYSGLISYWALLETSHKQLG